MQRRNTNVSFLIWDPVEESVRLHPPNPPRTCQGGSAVCFPLQREDTFNKSDGRVYFLHVGGRGTQDGLYPLPGKGKVSSRRPLSKKGEDGDMMRGSKRKNLPIKLTKNYT